MKNTIIAGLLLGMAHGFSMPVQAEDKITKGYYTMDAMGCMLLKECTKDVERINSSIDLEHAFPQSDWDAVKEEFDYIMIAFKNIGVQVYLADERYFPVGHRGVYHTSISIICVSILMSVVRHEGWLLVITSISIAQKV